MSGLGWTILQLSATLLYISLYLNKLQQLEYLPRKNVPMFFHKMCLNLLFSFFLLTFSKVPSTT